MTRKANRSIGTKIEIGEDVIADVTSIGSPSITQEEIDVTTLDSAGGYREFIPGFKDSGELSISGYFVPTDVGQEELYAALDSGEVQDFTVTYPPSLGAKWEFEGFVTAYNVTAEVEGAIEFEATIRVSGKPTLTIEPPAP